MYLQTTDIHTLASQMIKQLMAVIFDLTGRIENAVTVVCLVVIGYGY